MIYLPKMPSSSLKGKTALVTGASSGLGQGAAVALAQAGAHVLCIARGKDRLEASVAAMQANGWSAEAHVLDIIDTDAMDAFCASQEIDVLVNAAGSARHSAAIDTQREDYDRVMEINTRAAYFVSTAAAKNMMRRNVGGSIIHISSQMAHVGGIDRAVYCASKFAVAGMVKAMAIEWGKQGIRVNTICPKFIRTPLNDVTFQNPERLAWIEEKIKLGRAGQVRDIMGAVLFLATDLSSLVTGSSVMVDGGWTAD